MSTFNRSLITAAAGEIGGTLRAGPSGVYPPLRLNDVRPRDAAAAGEEILQADLDGEPERIA